MTMQWEQKLKIIRPGHGKGRKIMMGVLKCKYVYWYIEARSKVHTDCEDCEAPNPLFTQLIDPSVHNGSCKALLLCSLAVDSLHYNS